MAIIDEYKQAVQDVLDGRVPDAPHPGELPNTEDKLAAQSFAAAALAKVLEEGGDAPEFFIVQHDETWNHTFSEIAEAIDSGKIAVYISGGDLTPIKKASAAPGHYQLRWQYGNLSNNSNTLYWYLYIWGDTDETPSSSRWYVSMTKE